MFEEGNRKKRWYDWLGFFPARVVRLLLFLGLIPLGIAIILGVYAYRANSFDLDEITTRLENCLAYDSQGKLIGPLSTEARVNVSREDLPECLVHAFIAREDEDFFDHGGIVYTSMIRSMLRNLTSMSYAQGGSTITMQLARNCYELKDKTIDRKILEMALSRRIESRFDKDTILTSYLNRIYFGQRCYGVAQAARTYFGKKVSDLNLAECATLAGLVRGPSIFNPVTDKAASIRERNDTLDRMEACGFISPEECEEAKGAPMELRKAGDDFMMSYPAMWIAGEMEHLQEEREEETSSLIVLTSLDLEEQRELERSCENELRELEASPVWKDLPKRVDAKAEGCIQVAAMCVESSTGHILAVVGGRCPLDGVDRWHAKRKAGFLFVPLVNLGAADRGRNIIRNAPVATGRAVGYRRTKEIAEMAGIRAEMPDSDDLYSGQFDMMMADAVRSLMVIQQKGRNVPLNAIMKVATGRKALVFSSDQNHEDEGREILPREAARIVSGLPPFSLNIRTKLLSLQGRLPDGGGFFSARMGGRRSVFVWVGFDRDGAVYESKKGVASSMSSLSSRLSMKLYTAMMDRYKQAEARKKGQMQKEQEVTDNRDIPPADSSSHSDGEANASSGQQS
jgi:membrane peptidoglycan carboxypeptidase